MLKLNYAVLAGVLAGSVTDPPALAFATNITKSDAPTVAYAAVTRQKVGSVTVYFFRRLG